MNDPVGQTRVGLLDTSVFIQARHLNPADLPEEFRLSAVTLAELAVGPLVAKDAAEQAARQQHVQLALAAERLPFDDACAHAFAVVAAGLRRTGSKRRAGAFASLIAATAIANSLPLYTGNPDDFDGIPALDVRAVPIPAR